MSRLTVRQGMVSLFDDVHSGNCSMKMSPISILRLLVSHHQSSPRQKTCFHRRSYCDRRRRVVELCLRYGHNKFKEIVTISHATVIVVS